MGDRRYLDFYEHTHDGQLCEITRVLHSLWIEIVFEDGYRSIVSESRLVSEPFERPAIAPWEVGDLIDAIMLAQIFEWATDMQPADIVLEATYTADGRVPVLVKYEPDERPVKEIAEWLSRIAELETQPADANEDYAMVKVFIPIEQWMIVD